jgi:hypothetical protein
VATAIVLLDWHATIWTGSRDLDLKLLRGIIILPCNLATLVVLDTCLIVMPCYAMLHAGLILANVALHLWAAVTDLTGTTAGIEAEEEVWNRLQRRPGREVVVSTGN